jgi:hypothetical protein
VPSSWLRTRLWSRKSGREGRQPMTKIYSSIVQSKCWATTAIVPAKVIFSTRQSTLTVGGFSTLLPKDPLGAAIRISAVPIRRTTALTSSTDWSWLPIDAPGHGCAAKSSTRFPYATGVHDYLWQRPAVRPLSTAVTGELGIPPSSVSTGWRSDTAAASYSTTPTWSGTRRISCSIVPAVRLTAISATPSRCERQVQTDDTVRTNRGVAPRSLSPFAEQIGQYAPKRNWPLLQMR